MKSPMICGPRPFRNLTMVATCALLTACGADFDGGEPTGSELGAAELALGSSCVGVNDTDSLSATFAVATATELGRWDVANDFMVSNGKLEYSPTGILLCGAGGVNCPQTTALLRLQDDASSTIPNHSPSHYRSTLVSRFNKQVTVLKALVDQMLNVDQGVYQIRNQRSGKLLVPQGGSTASGAVIQQSDAYNGNSASQWRVALQGTRQQLKNVKSGLCMDLQTNTTGTATMVQRSCSTSSTQGFRLAVNNGVYWVRTTAPNMTLTITAGSTSNGASLMQNLVGTTSAPAAAQFFSFEKVGSGPHRNLLETAKAAYSIKASHSNGYMAVPSASLTEGLPVVQNSYISADKRFHWYVTPVGTAAVQGSPLVYQLINRRTGKCLDLTATAPYKAVQKTCSTSASQQFLFVPTGDGTQVLYTLHGMTFGVPNGSTSSGSQFAEVGSGWQPYNKLLLSPILAGEPHRLEWAYSTTEDAPCGQYDWFDIERPNGTPLEDPADTYVQLIFAGGKATPTGSDVNPYIAQQVNGNQVAIDPTYGLNESGTTSTGSCSASCVMVSSTSIAGKCCSCSGLTKSFVKSTWNASTYLCK
jgi:hypothetical protein